MPEITNNEFEGVVSGFVAACQQKPDLTDDKDTKRIRETNRIANRYSSPSTESSRTTPENANENLFGFLINTTPDRRKRLFDNTNPLNTAIALSFLPAELVGETLNALAPESRVEILQRMSEVDQYDSQDVANLSLVLRSRIEKLTTANQVSTTDTTSATRPTYRAATDQSTKPPTRTNEDATIQNRGYLVCESPEIAYTMERSNFDFADLKCLPNDEVKLLLSHVDTACWAPALKNSNLNLQKKILKNLADKPREMLSQEISELGSIDSLISNQAQQKILETCLTLQAAGEIQLPGSCTIQLV